MVRPEVAQATLDGPHHAVARKPLVVGTARVIRVPDLRGEHHFVAPALHGLADDLLGEAAAVVVGRVDVVAPGVAVAVDHPLRLFGRRAAGALLAEEHATQAHFGGQEPAAAQLLVPQTVLLLSTMTSRHCGPWA